jgi:hypothetical protein
MISNLLSKLTGEAPKPNSELPTTSEPNQAENPEKFFAELFSNNAPSKESTNENDKDPWDVSPETLSSNFGNIDISQYINKETLTNAMSGDPQAFIEVLNTAVKIGAMSAHQASITSTKHGVEHSTKQQQQQLPEQFRNMALENSLGQDPVLSAPHLQPVVKMIKDSILAKYPKATEADIKEGVSMYLQELGGKFSSNSKENTSSKESSKSIDWDEHFKNL